MAFGFCLFVAGPKPSELFGKHTWKIEKFSQINKRELRDTPFDVGGYKWYDLMSNSIPFCFADIFQSFVNHHFHTKLCYYY